MADEVTCRADVSPRCEKWVQRELAVDDGTFDAKTNTFVCDSCYVRLMQFSPSGKALIHELPAAIEAARAHDRNPVSTEGS